MTVDFEALARFGVAALKQGDAKGAQAAFTKIDAAGRATQELRVLLAQAALAADDPSTAHQALKLVLERDPANLVALVLRGDILLREGDPRAAVSWYQAALVQAARAGPLPPSVVAALRRAEAAVDQASAEFEAHLDRALKTIDSIVTAAGPRFREARDILAGRASPYPQQPTNFYYPGLGNRPFFERSEFPWIEAIEAAAPAIRHELAAVLADDASLSPYVAADANRPAKRHALLGDPKWSAFHLIRNGAPVAENVARCPMTMAALAHAPIPVIVGRSPMALFSILRPNTHIPSHSGMLNTRLICHLPVIVPEKCRLRVGNQVRAVEMDRVMIFDDSIEHEAWNDSDAIRVVLLFEIWRPDLSAAERDALTTLYEAIGDYTPAPEDQAGA